MDDSNSFLSPYGILPIAQVKQIFREFSLDITRQTASLVINPITVDGYASLFNCTTAVRASDSMTASS